MGLGESSRPFCARPRCSLRIRNGPKNGVRLEQVPIIGPLVPQYPLKEKRLYEFVDALISFRGSGNHRVRMVGWPRSAGRWCGGGIQAM